MEIVIEYLLRGIESVFFTSEGAFDAVPVLMVLSGIITGIVVGATPGLSGPFAMALSLPVLISLFGVSDSALLPILGFLIGVMKGGTLGGAVPAILFNTPGTPDAFLTTLDGYPMAQRGQGLKALKIAHFSSVTGDTISDIALFCLAPFLAILIESYMNVTEKAALIILSLSFMAAVAGRSPLKGMVVGIIGMLCALVGSTLSGAGPRLTLGIDALGNGLPLTSAILGVLVVGEVFAAIEDLVREGRRSRVIAEAPKTFGNNSLTLRDIRFLLPRIFTSAGIGTMVGALPGIGTTLAAMLGYEAARRASKTPEKFGHGSEEGLAATEAANSAVSGANLIPVLSLGIPGNFAAVFLILAIESVGDFTLGPSLFRFTEIREIEGYGTIMNESLVMVFGIFTLMVLGNFFNWTVGWWSMRGLGIFARVPKSIMLPIVMVVTLTGVYAQDGGFVAIWVSLALGLIGYLMRRLDVSLLPFVIGFILAPGLEVLVRGGYSSSGYDPYFMLKSPLAMFFLILSVLVIVLGARKNRRAGPGEAQPHLAERTQQ